MQQSVFRAVADPTRREIIAMLSKKPMSTGEVAGRFRMSRPAVAKHLKILSDGGLISSQKRGRVRINTLNPAPLKAVSDWAAQFDKFWDDRLNALKTQVESDK